MELSVLTTEGKDSGKKVSLNDAVFGVEPNDHVIYLDVKQYLANQRQGTHKAKERGEIAGSTRKIKRQKGTGTARAGSIKSPVFRGGGRVFGPRQRDYGFKVNKKVKRLARKSALSYKAQDNAIMVVEDFSFEAPKTKEFASLLQNLQVSDKKTLLVVAEDNKSVYLSARNLPKAKVLRASDINTYDVMNASQVVLCEGSVEKIETALS